MKNKKYLYFKILGFIFIILSLILSFGVLRHSKGRPLPKPRQMNIQGQLEPWMTIRYIGRSYGINSMDITSKLNLKIKSDKESIEEIAKDNKLSSDQVINLIQNIITLQKNR